MGTVQRIITKETIGKDVLDPAIREALKEQSGKDDKELIDNDDEDVELYTLVQLTEHGNWEVKQEVEGLIIEGTQTAYPKDKSPWMALRLISVDNEDYGRSYVEEYLGDLKSLEGLTKAIVEAAAAASKTLIFVNPNGTTRKRVVATANNLDVLEGNAADVTFMRSEKQGDFGVAMQVAKEITERLSYAFMLNSAVQRKGDRVTAEEIRYMASELEDALGGIYSVLAQELQLPLVSLLMSRMQRMNKIPSLPKGMVKPTITTGMEGLGRTAELQKLDLFITSSAQTLGAEVIAKFLNVDEYFKRRATALQIDTENLIFSQKDVEAKEQKAQMMAMAQGAVPNLVKGATDAMTQQSAPPSQ